MTRTRLDAMLSATRDRIAGLKPHARELARRAAAAPAPPPFARALRSGGASGVLLIARALPPDRLGALARTARANALGVLVEVHSEPELDQALTVEPTAVGVNSRDLATFAVDLRLTERLLARVPAAVPAI